MRKGTVLTLSLLFLGAFALTGGDCPLIPEVTEKAIELAMGGSTTMLWEARGSINEYSDTDCISINGEEGSSTYYIDVEGILRDADMEPDSVSAITLVGVSRRVVKPQAGRTISNGNVTIQNQLTGQSAVLVSGFFADAGAVTDFITEDLNPAGVALINAMLADALVRVQNGNSVPIEACVTVSGNSNPATEFTDFDWELKVDVNIVGTILIDTVDF